MMRIMKMKKRCIDKRRKKTQANSCPKPIAKGDI